jgi:hypothetical protein
VGKHFVNHDFNPPKTSAAASRVDLTGGHGSVSERTLYDALLGAPVGENIYSLRSITP